MPGQNSFLFQKKVKTYDDIRQGMQKLSRHVTGSLSEEEKSSVLSMLFRLHEFHKLYFEENKEEEIEELLGLSPEL